jgi:hypothetical protein
MKGIGPVLLAVIIASICCGGHLIIALLSTLTLSWFMSWPGLVLGVILSSAIVVLVWYRKRQNLNCQCDALQDQSNNQPLIP